MDVFVHIGVFFASTDALNHHWGEVTELVKGDELKEGIFDVPEGHTTNTPESEAYSFDLR